MEEYNCKFFKAYQVFHREMNENYTRFDMYYKFFKTFSEANDYLINKEKHIKYKDDSYYIGEVTIIMFNNDDDKIYLFGERIAWDTISTFYNGQCDCN